MKTIIVTIFLLLSGCATKLIPPTQHLSKSISSYKYVVIPEYKDIVYINSSAAKEMSPDDLIEGILLKKGIFRIRTQDSNNKNNLLIAKFATSGKREVMLGYTMEVTIALLDARSLEVVYTCTAEGMGATEVDDVREAIIRCLSGIE